MLLLLLLFLYFLGYLLTGITTVIRKIDYHGIFGEIVRLSLCILVLPVRQDMSNTSYFTKETCSSGSIGNLGNQYRYLEKLANVYAEMINR